MSARILVVDNYDSFVFNLVQYLGQLGAECVVRRNDEVTPDEVLAGDVRGGAYGDLDGRLAGGPHGGLDGGADGAPASGGPVDGVLLSPGPGTPEDAGVCVEMVRALAGVVPVFGVCLGHQAIGVAYGAVVGRAPELLHGKTSEVHHKGEGVLAGLPDPFTATRYHSLAVTEDTLPSDLEVTARTRSGVVMALRHREVAVEGVQFHPESVLTQAGHQMLANWLAVCGDSSAGALAPALVEQTESRRLAAYA